MLTLAHRRRESPSCEAAFNRAWADFMGSHADAGLVSELRTARLNSPARSTRFSAVALDVTHAPAKGRAGAQTNIRAGELYAYAARCGLGNRLEPLRLAWQNGACPEWPNAAVAGWIAVLMVSPVREHLLRLIRLGLLHLELNAYISVCKRLHDELRKDGRLMGEPVSSHERVHLQYLQCIAGRGDYATQPTGDLISRCTPLRDQAWVEVTRDGRVLLDNARWQSELRISVDALLARCAGGVRCETFEDFWSRRLGWVASGSAPGIKFDLRDLGFGVLRPNKRLALERLDLGPIMRAIYTERGELLSRMVDKYELAKNRVLWNSQVLHYMVSCYVLEAIEAQLGLIPELESYSESLNGLREQFLMLVTSTSDTPTWMYDYSDFNINHGLGIQRYIYLRCGRWLGDHAEDARARNDALHAAQWLAYSLDHTWLQIPGQAEGRMYRGMLTGIRGTAFFNTLLNVAYAHTVRRNAKALIGVDPVVEYRGRGDDIWSSLRNVVYGPFLTDLMLVMGLAGQDSKILYGLGEGEFLRKDYRDGLCRGFLLRTVPNAVSGEFFGVNVNDVEQMGAAMFEYLNKLLVRGADRFGATVLTHALLTRRNKQVCRRGGRRHVTLYMAGYYNISVLGGGSGLNIGGCAPRLARLECPRLPSRLAVPREISTAVRGALYGDLQRDWSRLGLGSDEIARLHHLVTVDNLGSSLPSDLVRELRGKMAFRHWWLVKRLRVHAFDPKLPPLPAGAVNLCVAALRDNLSHTTAVHRSAFGCVRSSVTASGYHILEALDAARPAGVDSVDWYAHELARWDSALPSNVQLAKQAFGDSAKLWLRGDLRFDDMRGLVGNEILGSFIRNWTLTYVQNMGLQTQFRGSWDVVAIVRVIEEAIYDNLQSTRLAQGLRV
nr:RNA-dependent RNA polymerase [Phytophthora castaneae RNA virus 4]